MCEVWWIWLKPSLLLRQNPHRHHTTTTTFGFCFTGLFIAYNDHSKLDRVSASNKIYRDCRREIVLQAECHSCHQTDSVKAPTKFSSTSCCCRILYSELLDSCWTQWRIARGAVGQLPPPPVENPELHWIIAIAQFYGSRDIDTQL